MAGHSFMMMKSARLVLLFQLLPALFAVKSCEYIPQNVQAITQHYVNFTPEAELVVGSGPDDYQWLNCPCFTGLLNGGFLQTNSDESGLLASNQAFLVPPTGQVQLSATLNFYDNIPGSCNTTDLINMNENPFYGYGTLTAADWSSGWSFGFLLTNYKIFAIYARNPAHQDPYSTLQNFPFTYLIPIAPRWPSAISTFSLVMDSSASSVSYRIDEVEKLYLPQVGQAVDRRFLVNTNVPDPNNCPDTFPESFHVVIGNGRLVSTGPNLEQVCQNAIFDQCKESVRQATNTNCTYKEIPQEPFDKLVRMTSVFYDLSVVQWYDSFNCREQDCRLTCRIPACPFESCSECSSHQSSSSSSHGGCVIVHSSSSDSDKPHHPRRHRAHKHPRGHVIDANQSNSWSQFCFDSNWPL